MRSAARRALGGLAAAAALLPATGSARDEDWGAHVQRLVAHAGALFARGGYRPDGELRTGALNGGTRERFELRLRGGTRVGAIAVCDSDCSNLDLALHDAGGRSLAEDVEDDAVPILIATIPADGSYSLEVRMVDCAAEPCRFGVQQYVK